MKALVKTTCLGAILLSINASVNALSNTSTSGNSCFTLVPTANEKSFTSNISSAQYYSTAKLSFTLQNPSDDLHTNLETMFKSLGLALDQATTIDSRRAGKVPSTKGIID